MEKTVVLGVCGGIAAYKSVDIASKLRKEGVAVRCIMTANATHFVAPLTFETVTNHPVAVDMFAREQPWEVEHISLAKAADLFLVAPASANFIGKLAHGIADDMLTTTAMATSAPMLLAPAMNTGMYQSAATQANLQLLARRGVHFAGPESGLLACGDIGPGRMSEPQAVVDAVLALLRPEQPMAGMHVLVTAGPTREQIDPVRYISNNSSGKMGYALARQAAQLGARVTLVSGPCAISAPSGVDTRFVTTTQEMYNACVEAFPACDMAVMAAAPADYRMVTPYTSKQKKSSGPPKIELAENPDIAAALGDVKHARQKLIIFAAETDDLLANARRKLAQKKADLVVANDITSPGAGFDVDTNVATIVSRLEETPLPLMDKEALAREILLCALKI